MAGLEDDLVALARRRREVLGQQADRGLGIGAWQVEVVAEVAAAGGAQHEREDGGQEPSGEHDPSVLKAKSGESFHRGPSV